MSCRCCLLWTLMLHRYPVAIACYRLEQLKHSFDSTDCNNLKSFLLARRCIHQCFCWTGILFEKLVFFCSYLCELLSQSQINAVVSPCYFILSIIQFMFLRWILLFLFFFPPTLRLRASLVHTGCLCVKWPGEEDKADFTTATY